MGEASDGTRETLEAGGDETLAAGPGLRRDGADAAPVGVDTGEEIGRYVVLRKIGAGGMGVVYAAYDPDLDRKVALKVLRTIGDEAEGGSTHGRARLLREGQALAKLSHPNVVSVHDVGTVRGQSWVAMEFVEGHTLGEWAKSKRSWEEVLDLMERAAQGLAAAHAAGILHRDFKPDNVMVGADGRVRVMDFGLARAEGAKPAKPANVESSADSLDVSVTKVGAILGTPAYMAPEQFRGEVATAASDQFSFCATLWELLYSERAYKGSTVHALAAAVLDGKRQPAPSGVKVPRWLRRICERGLSTASGDRFESLDALLRAVDAGRRSARLARFGLVLALAGTVGAATLGYTRWEEGNRVRSCVAQGDAIQEVWNPEVEREVRTAMDATGVPYAGTSADKIVPWLDEQANAWSSAQTEACSQHVVAREWTADRLERAAWCLDERKIELETVVDELRRADAQVVRRATTAVSGLRKVDGCLDERVLANVELPPDDARAELRGLRVDLARASAQEFAGRYEDALKQARAVREAAERLEWPPLATAAGTLEGRVLERRGLYEESTSTLSRSYTEAARHGAWDVAMVAAARLSYVVGNRSGRWEDAVTWAELQRVASTQAGDPDGTGEAEYLATRAAVHVGMREYDEGVALYEQAREVLVARLGEDSPRLASLLNNLGGVLFRQGDLDGARDLYERAIETKERIHGEDHPNVAVSLSNLAVVYNRLGQLDRAVQMHERALDIRERALGPDHSDLGASLHNLGNVYSRQERHEDAKKAHIRSLRIRRATLPAGHPDLGGSLSTLASDHRSLGEYEEAYELYVEAREVVRTNLGEDDLLMGSVVHQLGACERGRGNLEAAGEHFATALKIFDAKAGESGLEPGFRFDYAQYLWDTGEKEAAMAEAELAKTGYGKHPDAKELARVEAWLAERAGP